MLEVNSYELINKCSTFVLFDLIRSVGGREATTEKRLRSTTEATNATEATATVVALIQLAASTLLKV